MIEDDAGKDDRIDSERRENFGLRVTINDMLEQWPKFVVAFEKHVAGEDKVFKWLRLLGSAVSLLLGVLVWVALDRDAAIKSNTSAMVETQRAMAIAVAELTALRRDHDKLEARFANELEASRRK